MEIRPTTESEIRYFKKEWDKVATRVTWNPQKYFFGLFDDSELLGYTIFETNGGGGHLHEIIVAEKYRRNDYGTRLMKHFVEFCKKEGCHKLTLRTSEDHTDAINFYKKLGFQVEAIHPDDKDHLTWYTYFMRLK